jgi:hypothetical protein
MPVELNNNNITGNEVLQEKKVSFIKNHCLCLSTPG